MNIPRPTSMKEGNNSLWDVMKGNTPSGVVDARFSYYASLSMVIIFPSLGNIITQNFDDATSVMVYM